MMRNIFLVRHFWEVISYPSSPLYSHLGGMRMVLVFEGSRVCCKHAAFAFSHSAESGDQGENQRTVFLFHTQMKVPWVTFICFPVLSFLVCVVVSIFCVSSLCWGHETPYDFKNIPWGGCHHFPTLALCRPHSVWTWESFLCMSVFTLKTPWARISQSSLVRDQFSEGMFSQGGRAFIFERLGSVGRTCWSILPSWPFCHGACNQELYGASSGIIWP